MRIIPAELIKTEIIRAIGKISYRADEDLLRVLSSHYDVRAQTPDQEILGMILKNNTIAAADGIPICQDTGTTVAIVELGNEVYIEGAALPDILNAAVREAHKTYCLRASMLSDPVFRRENTGDNSPGILHLLPVSGDRLIITIAQKGGGAENMSFMHMMNPSASVDEIADFVVSGVIDSGSKACPPLVIGIGIGGNFESCCLMSKLALFERIGRVNHDLQYSGLELQILERINLEGCGVQGMGGKLTAIAVHIRQAPCHIASLPVAVNLQCHAHRHCSIEI